MTEVTQAAKDAAAQFLCRDDGDFPELAMLFQTYGEHIAATARAEAEAKDAEIVNLSQQIEALAYENGTLKAIVQGWHYLAVGPDEMGDYYTHKQLVKASEPYASPALKALSKGPTQ